MIMHPNPNPNPYPNPNPNPGCIFRNLRAIFFIGALYR